MTFLIGYFIFGIGSRVNFSTRNSTSKLKKEGEMRIDLSKEEILRVKYLKEGIIEELQEHTADTLGNLEATLKRGLEAIEREREKLRKLSEPLP